MNSAYLDQLRACCRDQAAFEQMQQLLALACDQSAPEPSNLLDQSRAAFQAVAKIRQSLDLDTTVQTAVEEVRQLLKADRAAIFRFDPALTGGEFIAESVLPQFPSILAARVQHYCFGELDAISLQSGQVDAIADIHTAGLRIGPIDDFARFQVRASLTVPLLQDHPWGLLCLHQCATARVWQPQEIELVTQISTQLAVALQQSELFVQTQQQAQAFAVAFHQLQPRHMQQAKLSSLGRLMAGLTEEINHPVGFICSSLSHANQYAQQLLELVELYQQEHTTPSPALQQALETLDLNFIAEDFPKLLAAMQLGGERICQMVLALQRFSSPDAPQMQPTNLHEGIDNTLLILQHRLKPRSNCRGIQVVCEYGDVPPVECYPNQINQVFLYLISNAIDALEEKQLAEQNNEQNQNNDLIQSSAYRPQMTIRTLQIPDPQGGNPRVIICIADNGGGIPDVIQDKLFEPFSTTKSVEGDQSSGLGLFISRDIVVNTHGGDLQCYSQLGVGSEFWIELPVKQTGGSNLSHRWSVASGRSHRYAITWNKPITIHPVAQFLSDQLQGRDVLV